MPCDQRITSYIFNAQIQTEASSIRLYRQRTSQTSWCRNLRMRAWVRERERERERVEESGDLDFRRISVGGIRFFRGRLQKYHVLSPTKEWESERAERCENKGSMSQREREREWGEKDMSNMPHTVCPFTSLCLVPMTNAFFESLSLSNQISLSFPSPSLPLLLSHWASSQQSFTDFGQFGSNELFASFKSNSTNCTFVWN